MITRKRKSAEQLLADYQNKIVKLQERVDKKKTANLIKLGKVVQNIFGETITTEEFIKSLNYFTATVNLNKTHFLKKLNVKLSELLNDKKISQDDYNEAVNFLEKNSTTNEVFFYCLYRHNGEFDEKFIKFMLNDVIANKGEKFKKALLTGKDLKTFFLP